MRCGSTQAPYLPLPFTLLEPLIYCTIWRIAVLCPRSTLAYLCDKPRASLRDALPCIPLSQEIRGSFSTIGRKSARKSRSARSRRAGRLGFGLLGVFFPESFHTPFGINDFLRAGKEGMTGRTNVHLDIAHGRTGLEFHAACATDRRLGIFGMNACFHDTDVPLKTVPKPISSMKDRPLAKRLSIHGLEKVLIILGPGDLIHEKLHGFHRPQGTQDLA